MLLATLNTIANQVSVNNKLIITLCFSILLHIGIIGRFALVSKISKKSSLWSGGLSSGQYRVSYVDLKSLRTYAPTRLRANGKSIKKTKGPKAHRPTGPMASGTGASNTPAGGSGSGLDSAGMVSSTAPNTLALIRKKIMQEKHYPLMAKERGWIGSVTLNFKINAKGTLDYVKVTSGSGHSVLDKAAVSSIKKAAPFPYYQNTIALALEYKLSE